MEEKFYSPQEVADFLKIKKTTVYDMIKRGSIQAVKMGKQFRISQSDLQQYTNKDKVEAKSSELPEYGLQELKSSGDFQKYIVSGQDIVLDMLCSAVNSILGSPRFLRSYEGSYNGLLSLYHEEAQIASTHLWDINTDTYNIPFVKAMLPGEQVSIYRILERDVFIYVQKGNPKGIKGIEDFAREDITIVNRERGSGMRVLLDSLLTQKEIPYEVVKGYQRISNSHLAAASIIARGGADCTLGTAAATYQFQNIDRIFLRQEQYDLVIRKSEERKPEIQCFLQVLSSKSFQEEVEAMGLYNTERMGLKLL